MINFNLVYFGANHLFFYRNVFFFQLLFSCYLKKILYKIQICEHYNMVF